MRQAPRAPLPDVQSKIQASGSPRLFRPVHAGRMAVRRCRTSLVRFDSTWFLLCPSPHAKKADFLRHVGFFFFIWVSCPVEEERWRPLPSMEDLLRSLRNLGLKTPEPSQLLELLDEDEQVQERLAQILSLSSLEQDFAGGAALMGQDLLQEAVKALLDNFKRSLQRQQQAAKKEGQGLGARRVKWAPRKALLARQQAALQRAERERSESSVAQPRLVFDGPQSFCSTSTLDQLKRIGCADLAEAPRRYEGERDQGRSTQAIPHFASHLAQAATSSAGS